MAWCKEANTQLKKVLECNLNPISFSGMNKLISLSNGFTGTKLEEEMGLEQKMDPSLYCHHCKQLNKHCHFKVYGDYIEEKLFFLYTKKTVNPGDAVIYKQCQEVYNKKCRDFFHDMFHFYNEAECKLPYCCTKQAYKIETMIQNIVKPTDINDQTRRGVVKYICTKRFAGHNK